MYNTQIVLYNLKFKLDKYCGLDKFFRMSQFSIYKMEISANIYLFKVNDRNTIKKCEICSKLTIKKTEWRQWRLLVFLLLTLKIFQTFP